MGLGAATGSGVATTGVFACLLLSFSLSFPGLSFPVAAAMVAATAAAGDSSSLSFFSFFASFPPVLAVVAAVGG